MKATLESPTPLVLPEDEANRTLLAHVRPPNRKNPTPSGRYNLVVLGAGPAGLVCAAGAAGLGAKVALVEKHLVGGDCLNVGCVPSKALIRAARSAADAREASRYGVRVAGRVEVDFPAVMARMRGLRAQLAEADSVRRFESLGVDLYLGTPRFVGADAVEVDGRVLRFSRAILATGARAADLPIPGLRDLEPLTNETLFWLTELPRRLLVIGAGPIGCEMAQAFRRFGSDVTVVSLDPRLLPREDSDAAAILEERFRSEGIRLALGAKILRGERRGNDRAILYERDGRREEAVGDAVLVAIGRAPNVEGLDLERAGIAYDRGGVRVDDRLRTTNRRVYAAGDVCSPFKFTHAADAMARVALRNALFFGRRRASALVIPWCTYTDPEVAHVGLYGTEAESRGLRTRSFQLDWREVDRAVLDGEERGFARLLAEARSGRILGATIVARHAGEMIGEVVLAMAAGAPLGTLSETIHPYPTQASALKKLGDAWMREKLTVRARWLFEKFFRLRR